jgi:catechol 2,3-dioxygenase-like lactoylglutathione lyase family enzyme
VTAREKTFTVTGIDLSGYMVEDAPRAIAFYRDVLGMEPSRLYPDDRGAEYDLPDGSTFGLWGGGGKVMPFQPSNGVLFSVDDFSAAVAEVKRRGLPIAFEIELPSCSMVGMPDTEGNLVFLHRRKAAAG